MTSTPFLHRTRTSRHLILGLVAINLLVWLLAVRVFGGNAALMGSALLAWSFGLRHALDADHLAAIDNVTRKLMQQGQKPLCVGTFFSLGHSTIVVLACAAIAAASSRVNPWLDSLHRFGSVIGSSVSTLFLLVIALVNLSALISIWRQFSAVKRSARRQKSSDPQSLPGGLGARLFQRVFRHVFHSRHMYLVGFLFGLGFDTASEIGLLGLAASGAHNGLNLWALLLFPALFTAGMVLIDTLDNLVMVGAYGWAFAHPGRKLYYNLTITAASVVVALVIGGIEGLALVADRLALHGRGWDFIAALNDSLGNMGMWMVGLFVACWLISVVNYRLRGYDRLLSQA